MKFSDCGSWDERAECSTEMDQHARRLEHTARRQYSACDVELSAIRRANVLASRESGYRVAHSRQVVRCHPMETLEHLDWTQTLKRTRSVTSSQCKTLPYAECTSVSYAGLDAKCLSKLKSESLTHGIIYPLLSVLLVYPLLIGLLGALILEIFWNVIVVNLKGSC